MPLRPTLRPPYWAIRVLPLAVACILATILLGVMSLALSPAPTGLLVIHENYLRLGEVWASDDLRILLPIQNQSNRPVTIVDLTASCTCTQINPRALTIPAKSTAEIELSLQLGAGDSREACRPFVVDIVAIVPSLRTRVQKWQLSGIAKQAILGVPAVMDLGVFNCNQSLEHTDGHSHPNVSLQLELTQGITDVHVAADETRLFASLVRHSSGAPFLELAPPFPITPGTHAVPVTLHAIGKGGQRVARQTLIARYYAIGDLTIVPDSIAIPAQSLGESAGAEVAITSRSGAAIEIVDISAPCDVITVTPVKTMNACCLKYRVEHFARHVGTHAIDIVFHVRSAEDSHVVALPLRIFVHVQSDL